MSWEFLVTALVVVLMPGTGVVYTLAVSIGQGFRAGVVAALGCTLGILPHIAASILGLAAVLHASALAFQMLKIAGVLYLLWMAWSTWSGRGVLTVSGRSGKASIPRLVADGVFLNLLNPKLSVFFLAFLPQFVPADAPGAIGQLSILSVAFMIMTFVAFAIYCAFAASLRDRVLGRPGVMVWLRGTFAASFTILSLRLALESR